MNKTKPGKRVPMNIYFMEHLKDDLQALSNETGISMSHLVILATQSLISNYRLNGSSIFTELLDPKKRSSSQHDEMQLIDTRENYNLNPRNE